MVIGLLQAASLTATVAVVVDRFLPSSEFGAAETEAPVPSLRSVVDPLGARGHLPEPERSSDEQSCHPHGGA